MGNERLRRRWNPLELRFRSVSEDVTPEAFGLAGRSAPAAGALLSDLGTGHREIPRSLAQAAA